MDLKSLGEFGLIEYIKEQFPVPEGILGIGDDCAIIPQHTGRDTVVSTDMLVDGSHFLLEDIDPELLGWKSAAVNISDIAAMGARPLASFLSFALPKKLPAGFMEAFIRGYRDISARYGTALLGGDTTSSPDRLCISVTVLGECPSSTARKRSDARPGDLICVTGTLGDSAGGLRIILNGLPRDNGDARYLIERHYRPMPRVDEGLQLAATDGVHAMMDISDGIGSDLRHILEESGTDARVELGKIPVSAQLQRFAASEGIDPLDLAISGGEDYELLFTVSPDAESRISCPHHVIGCITERGADAPSIVWEGSDHDYIGFRHF